MWNFKIVTAALVLSIHLQFQGLSQKTNYYLFFLTSCIHLLCCLWPLIQVMGKAPYNEKTDTKDTYGIIKVILQIICKAVWKFKGLALARTKKPVQKLVQ